MTGPLAAQPEKLVDGLRRRLATHALWQTVLFFLPPLLAAGYVASFLNRFAWLDADILIVAGTALLCVAGLLVMWRFRSLIPSHRFAARLIDKKTEGQDRFVTLATIDAAVCSPELLSRLKLEAASLQSRVEFKRDFPFRVRRAFLNSCIGSLVAILLFHLLLELAPILKSEPRDGEELARLGEQLSRFPGLEKLADSLKRLAAQLDDPTLSKEEKRSLVEDLLNRIKEQMAGVQQETGGGEELLRQAANRLSGSEEGVEKGQGKGKGGRQRQPAQELGAGENKTGNGGEAEKQSGLNVAVPSLDTPGKPSGQELKGKGEGGERGERKNAQAEKGSGLARAPKKGMESKGGEDGSDRKSAGETPERFLRPGEKGQAGLKDSRFVTVQLPEEETGLQTGGAKRGSKRNRGSSAQLPSSNLPLSQPDQPDAPPEKQMLPLEYRGMIR